MVKKIEGLDIDGFDDGAFDELIEKGFLKKNGVNKDGEQEYSLTDKAGHFLNVSKLHKGLKNSAATE